MIIIILIMIVIIMIIIIIIIVIIIIIIIMKICSYKAQNISLLFAPLQFALHKIIMFKNGNMIK